MDRIVVVGGGGHAKVIISILKKSKECEIIGYTDLVDRGAILRVQYLGTDAVLPDVLKKNTGCEGVIGIGSVGVNDIRKKIYEKLHNMGFELPFVLSSKAIINEDVSIGDATVVMDGVVVNSGTVIGTAAILNTSSTIDHDCIIGDFVHVAPGVTLSGGVKVGDNSLIGTGANVIQSCTICANSLVGAGATVIENIVNPGVYLGTPARRKE